MRVHLNLRRGERSDKDHKGCQHDGEKLADNVVDNEDRTGRSKSAGWYKKVSSRCRRLRTAPNQPFTSSPSPLSQRSSLNASGDSVDSRFDDSEASSSQSEADFQLEHSSSRLNTDLDDESDSSLDQSLETSSHDGEALHHDSGYHSGADIKSQSSLKYKPVPLRDGDSDSGISVSDLIEKMPYIGIAPGIDSSWTNIQPASFVEFPRPCVNPDEEFKIRTIHFRVPLEHHKPSGQQINIHAELIWDTHERSRFESWVPACRSSPILLFLCGGPGDKNPHDRSPEMNRILLERGYVILFADYRGTGQSHKIDKTAINGFNVRGDYAGAADYLSLFRQDNIVRDLEAVRLCLEDTLHTFSPHNGSGGRGIKWTLLGQSYGGWVALTYLSFLPGSLAKVYLTAGLAPVMSKTTDEVYEALYTGIRWANERYYHLYSGDVELVRAVYNTLLSRALSFELPDGSGRKLTAQTFLTLGRKFVGGDPGLRAVHDFVEKLHGEVVRNSVIPPSKEVLTEFSKLEGFKLHSRPLYGVLHEAIYCNNGDVASEWSAQRVGKRWPEYKGWLQGKYVPEGQRLFFSGEMVFPCLMPEEFRQVGDLVASKDNWKPLYNLERLKENKVPVRAMVYRDDLAVDFELSKQTVNAVKGSVMVMGKPGWSHGSLRDNTDEVIQMLF
ncbi:Alpha/Beta hydrolase protein [Triangularia verruculosa]|uniref:Alpha/Beta hydrolase protein n=1 Tax=Triangularia verruculosa TaxID=2587418 RepID=A0AAN6X7D9_9PEZI|nr:Alpha/Beta hydrolase protein [Triangularia verruculosa]